MIEDVPPEVWSAVVVALLGIAEAVREYHKHGRVDIRLLGWDAKLVLFRFVRRNWFTVPKPEHPTHVVEDSPEDVELELAKLGFAPDWPLSYRYKGERANLRYFFYDPTKKLPHRQLHVRLFVHPRGTEIMAHIEPTPEHHPDVHLDEGDMEFEAAVEWVAEELDNPSHVGYPAD